MFSKGWLILVLSWMISVVAGMPASAEGRKALVIGNAGYETTQPLANPVRDARDVADALRRVGSLFDCSLTRGWPI
ncbi:caspase family protein [Azospirillum argentinense]|uniref:Caspase family protein n=1 Tax=Azospirillum brasilense TaxID=192 RepID=A0A4D8QF09_AZOBR|nr:caspase family protein [Azospirillum argentinense]QCO07433.1 hypothetical protein D3867_36730 [Azospirillum argentinense]